MKTSELIAELTRLGVRLEAHGDRLRYYPRSLVTPALADRLKAHKCGLLAMLQSESVESPAKAVCRCGSTHCRDVLIHNGESVRRDCGRCGKFLGFPVWYGNDTLQNEQ